MNKLQVLMSDKHRIAVWYSVRGDLKYLSHRDTMRLWQMALVRARVPVYYSRGFNPHPRISLPLPRSVGMSSERELLLLDLEGNCDIASAWNFSRLQRQLPQGMDIFAAWHVPPKTRAVPQWAGYRITLSNETDQSVLGERIEHFLQAPTWPVWRPARGRHPRRLLDLRADVTDLKLHGQSLCCTIAVKPSGTPRLDEVLTALKINMPAAVSEICREATGYPGVLDAGAERK
ncbi:MAG: TIGR03936 family radical SAM-associated protein [Sedimentisphaerales bacterium]|nr:TIGR03936 family radical SAM-associated protein [Sedimentisphaerales bacterium]